MSSGVKALSISGTFNKASRLVGNLYDNCTFIATWMLDVKIEEPYRLVSYYYDVIVSPDLSINTSSWSTRYSHHKYIYNQENKGKIGQRCREEIFLKEYIDFSHSWTVLYNCQCTNFVMKGIQSIQPLLQKPSQMFVSQRKSGKIIFIKVVL